MYWRRRWHTSLYVFYVSFLFRRLRGTGLHLWEACHELKPSHYQKRTGFPLALRTLSTSTCLHNSKSYLSSHFDHDFLEIVQWMGGNCLQWVSLSNSGWTSLCGFVLVCEIILNKIHMPKTLWLPVKLFHLTMNYLDWLTWTTSWLNISEAGCIDMASLVEVGI